MHNIPVSQPRIPTLAGLLGVLLLLAVLTVTTLNFDKVKSLTSSADASAAPDGSVETANISDNSITIYWTTSKPINGVVFYGQTPSLEKGVATDDRDVGKSQGQYLTHFVRLSSLKAQTKYYFKVGSGSSSFGDPAKNQTPFEETTGPILSQGISLDPIFGKALDAAGNPVKDAVAVWQSPGASKLAALVKTDANYVVPIATARNVTLASYLPLTSGTVEKITINAGSAGTAVVNCQIGSDRPIVPVKLGQTLDCRPTAPAPASASTPAPTPPKSTTSGFKVPSSSGSVSQSAGQLNLNITSGQTVSSPLPTISGTAGSNQLVKIEIHSETPYSGAVVAGPDGSWSWTPPANLAPGSHTVTITVVNPDGSTQKITRDFYVGSGSAIVPITSGTPSAQPTHLACVNNACQSVPGSGQDTCSSNSGCSAATPPVTGSESNSLVLLTLGSMLLTLSMLTIFFVL